MITFRQSKTCTLVEMDFDPDTVVRKRLHVAGLTPGVSASDLTQRLGTFGTVVAVDGVGALDEHVAHVRRETLGEGIARLFI